LIMRNTKTGAFEVYDIANNQITGAAFLGTVGLDWQVAGFGPISGPGASALVMRNVNTGAVEVSDIANNQIQGAAGLGSVGLDWRLGAVHPKAAPVPSASVGDPGQVAQPAQAMASFGGGGGAGESLNPAALSAEPSQQPLLTPPQQLEMANAVATHHKE